MTPSSGTRQHSLRYTAISVGVELVLGLIIALLLQRQTRIHNMISVLLLLR